MKQLLIVVTLVASGLICPDKLRSQPSHHQMGPVELLVSGEQVWR